MISPLLYSKNVRPNLKILRSFESHRRISLSRAAKCEEKNIPSNDKPEDKQEKDKKDGEKKYPEEPSTCCMSGCANCVWLDYAQKLTEYYSDGGEKALKEIEEKVSDPNIKAFLLHELRMRNIKPK